MLCQASMSDKMAVLRDKMGVCRFAIVQQSMRSNKEEVKDRVPNLPKVINIAKENSF